MTLHPATIATTSPSLTVTLDGSTSPAPALQGVHGYTPAVDDRVLVATVQRRLLVIAMWPS